MLAGMLLLALLRESRHRTAADLFGAGDPYNAVDGETCAEMQSPSSLFSFLLPCATYAPILDETTEMRCLSPEESASIINSQLSSWELIRGEDGDGDSIHRSFEFKDFQHAFFFMSKSAQNAEKNQHHPLWTNVWNTVDVTWTTDDRQCLSTYDVAAALAMDLLFDEHPV
jgi:4a-hydroxytetrahydrobiopterin dehydratase